MNAPGKKPARDYWLGKLFFDLQDPAAATEYRQGRARVLDRYPLKAEVRQAIEQDDVPYLAALVNPYLLRFYFFVAGMTEAEFLRRIQSVAPEKAPHG
jgi:hypothetical protein